MRTSAVVAAIALYLDGAWGNHALVLTVQPSRWCSRSRERSGLKNRPSRTACRSLLRTHCAPRADLRGIGIGPFIFIDTFRRSWPRPDATTDNNAFDLHVDARTLDVSCLYNCSSTCGRSYGPMVNILVKATGNHVDQNQRLSVIDALCCFASVARCTSMSAQRSCKITELFETFFCEQLFDKQYEWPHLNVCLDQGSDGATACHALVHGAP